MFWFYKGINGLGPKSQYTTVLRLLTVEHCQTQNQPSGISHATSRLVKHGQIPLVLFPPVDSQ